MSRLLILAVLMLAYALTVLASFAWLVALHFSGGSLTPFEASVSLGLVLISVLNTPLTFVLKGKSAIHLFYAYHAAVHCLLSATIGASLLRWPLVGQSVTILDARGLFLGIYALSTWGLASQ